MTSMFFGSIGILFVIITSIMVIWALYRSRTLIDGIKNPDETDWNMLALFLFMVDGLIMIYVLLQFGVIV